MVREHIIGHALFFALVAVGYLLFVMLATSPRVWGYTDYPQTIKGKVPPQTAAERRLAWIIALPWMLFVLGFPIFSTYLLKAELGGQISFWVAFLNLFSLVLLANLGDLILLDWLIVSTITPDFVIIPGTDKQDYRDFSHHYRAHARSALILLLFCLALAGIISCF